MVFCIFLGRFLMLCMKTYTAFLVYHSSFLGKSFQWFWYYCFSHLYYTFLSCANKKSFKSKNSVGRKCCQLKMLKVLLMHLFVTLLINKATGSDNRHIFLNTLEKENKEEFLTYSTFCTLEQIEKNIYYGNDYPRMHYPKFI